ncbi:hypothetical protein [Frigoriglobus tundricola]|uniref:Uncharacterized protein n=1 Tax=Frigoriglobus tundricola TaxID=2774151 RepID=A0A6M5Z0L5_9BACT|nr:hypothetical protein [Frigoriglobus tundricola]QJW99344.1 hypothetical protein FTUN_6952 [Frigoriglobus tundricola]
MLKPISRFQPSLEALSDRLTPTTLPLGGSIVVTTAVHGTQLTESIVYTTPNGKEVTEEGTFAINLRTGAVNGTLSVTGPGGQVLATGAVKAVPISGGGYDAEVTVDGPGGQVLATGSVTAVPNSDGGYDGEVTVTGPGGRTFTHDFSIPVG